MKKLVNAGLKSKKEAALALIEGRVFHFNDRQIQFDADCTVPFSWSSGFAVHDAWEEFKLWEEEKDVHWYEDIPGGGVICWLGKGKTLASIVVSYNNGEFLDIEGRQWFGVEPVKPEECYQGVSDEKKN